MSLCDASPLIALVSTEEPEHQSCLDAFNRLSGPLLTTWVCFGEAMYMISRKKKVQRQRVLWRYVERGVLRFYNLADTDALRMRDLMVKYEDLPMDLADASLVVAAEALNLTQVFTLDQHFHAYRINDRTPFEVIP